MKMKSIDNEKHILCGPAPLHLLENVTSGQYLYNKLFKNIGFKKGLTDAHTGKTVSYKSILQESCCLAQVLLKNGYSTDGIIGVCSENNLYFLYPIIAALYLGTIVTPINVNFKEREMLSTLQIAKPTLIFSSRERLNMMIKISESLIFIKKIIILDDGVDIGNIQSLKNFIKENYTTQIVFTPLRFDINEQTALILYSSGTTGPPKGVMLTHKNLIFKFAQSRDPIYGNASHLQPQDAVLMYVPMFHSLGLLTTLSYLNQGLHVIIMNGFTRELFLKTIEYYKIASLAVVPSTLTFLAKSSLVYKYNLLSLTEIICAAAPLSADIFNSVTQRLNLKEIRQAYGLTECVGLLYTPRNMIKSGSCGKVGPFVSAKIVDLKNPLINLGPNGIGELCIRSGTLMKGYIPDLAATKNAVDKNGWFHTGDLAYYDFDGYFYILDRLKDMLKYNGYQISPTEIEATLLAHPFITDAAVFGRPDAAKGDLPTACIVLQTGKKLSVEDVENWVAVRLSNEKKLRGGVHFVENIPRNATTKILRKELSIQFARKNKL